ncbi:hypothetical protein BESB_012130 [Besnoitia besnoiti]|uniref:Uncharacterized protein n=1 Tax=Besnoitia besnoiti TaxID=94643 RepID=A0A2A9M8H0_BESBE|nr:hypothetical protein BESB_012130 [Besnoitia besnoiti]PFH32601.1 hypothetical protein BESB_012130 [Besnoitia besnoiti]
MKLPFLFGASRAALFHTTAPSHVMAGGGSANGTVRSQLCSLYRHVRRAAGKFKSPMFKEYFLRRAREDFRDMQDRLPCATAEEVNRFKLHMQGHCELLLRQGVVANLYHTDHIVYLK